MREGPRVITNPSRWVAKLPGHDTLIRINFTAPADTSCSVDLPGEFAFNQPVHPVVEFVPDTFRPRVGEYSAGQASFVVSMNADSLLGDPYPFYCNLDAEAVVRLYPISQDHLLSERGEEVTFAADGSLVLSRNGRDTVLHRGSVPTEESVSFQVPGTSAVLSGTLLRPAESSAVPGVVIVHGSGFAQRDFYRIFAHAIVRGGAAVLIFDKQGAGASTGEKASFDLTTNATGVEAALDFMSSRADISSVGLWGISNGMWTAPLVAARRPGTAFLAGMSAPGVTQSDAEIHRRTDALRQANISEDAIKTAGRAWRILFEVGAAGVANAAQIEDLENLLATLRADASVRAYELPNYATANPGLSPLPPLERAAEVVAMFAGDPDPDVGYDPADSYRQISCPVLLQYGSTDVNVPSQTSAARIKSALADGGNNHVTVSVYDAGHLLELVPDRVDGITYEQASYELHGLRFAPGVIRQLTEWIRSMTDQNVNP